MKNVFESNQQPHKHQLGTDLTIHILNHCSIASLDMKYVENLH